MNHWRMIPWTHIAWKRNECFILQKSSMLGSPITKLESPQVSCRTALKHISEFLGWWPLLMLGPSLQTFHYQGMGAGNLLGRSGNCCWPIVLASGQVAGQLLKPGVAWSCLELPSSWKQRFRPSLLNCHIEAYHGIGLAFSLIFIFN